jgi:DNA-binding beta-propeller fold protein YncE
MRKNLMGLAKCCDAEVGSAGVSPAPARASFRCAQGRLCPRVRWGGRSQQLRPGRPRSVKQCHYILQALVMPSLLALLSVAPVFAQESSNPLRLVATIPLLNVEGRIDHFGVDIPGRRLFMSALGNNTVEVFDLKTNQRLQTISGLHEPQGVLYDSASKKIFVANGDSGTCMVFDGASYKLLDTIHFSSDADNVRPDPAGGTVYVGYGEGGLGMLDASSAKQVGKIPLPAHPESFQLEKLGSRIFVNVPNAGQIIVLDRAKRSVVASWRLEGYRANFPMALDEADHRLFVVARRPAELLVFDTASGKLVAHLAAVGDSDDVWYDAALHRIYVSGGEGFISVFEQTDADHYRTLAKIPTAPGARTSFFSPDLRRLYLAVPHRGAQKCELRVYEVRK